MKSFKVLHLLFEQGQQQNKINCGKYYIKLMYIYFEIATESVENDVQARSFPDALVSLSIDEETEEKLLKKARYKLMELVAMEESYVNKNLKEVVEG